MRIIILFYFFFFLSGCTFYQKPFVPRLTKPEYFKYSISNSIKKLPQKWWENFNDPYLNKLIDQALTRNYDLKIAIKNICIAKSYVLQNESNLWPNLNLVFNTSRNRSQNLFNTNNFISSADTAISNNTNLGFSQFGRTFALNQLFGTISYELDIWNQIGNSVNQSKANVASIFAQSQVVKLTLISTITTLYFQIDTLMENLSTLKQQYKAALQLQQIFYSQYKSKILDYKNVLDANNQLETIKIAVENAKKQKELSVNTLAYLLGIYPEQFNFLSSKHKKVKLTNFLPRTIPAKILVNRPDIQASYLQILSFGYLEKQNIANFLPSFNFVGSYGYAGTNFSKLFNPTNVFWNYGLTTLQTIFDYKSRLAAYQRSKFQFETAFLEYQKTIIKAYQEVDDALVSYLKDSKSLQAYQKQNSFYKEKIQLAKTQYQAGIKDYTDVLNFKINYLQNQLNVNNQILAVKTDIIQLYKSLGLGLCDIKRQ